jgi:ribosomal protein S18 acetylase RimI-like enzyme
MTIERIGTVDDRLLGAVQRLIPQLSSRAQAPGRADLQALVESDAASLFVALVKKRYKWIVGMVTLVCYQVPSGRVARIEDLVVDQAARGHGYGRALTEAAIRHARTLGAKAVDLTSNPSRKAANHLYKNMGFRLGRTNVYRLWLE